MKTITILLPIFNETESFPLLKENIQQVIKDNSNYEWIILMINDGSTDNSLEKMKNLCQEDHHFHYIDLSRNYGKEIAIMAGIDYGVGDAIAKGGRYDSLIGQCIHITGIPAFTIHILKCFHRQAMNSGYWNHSDDKRNCASIC